MNVSEFIAKWSRAALGERQAAQQHFLDLCELFDHPKPAEVDPAGEWFTFEKGAAKHGGGEGFADVWKRGFFGWEYKGKHKDLDAAYDQLLKYREALENPPLLVVCDLDRIVVRTNFTGTRTDRHEILLSELGAPRNLEILRSVFHAPDKLRPGKTSEAITQEAASRVAEIAQALRGRGLEPHEVARFLDRAVFCLFAEDIGLLPGRVFSQVVEKTRHDPGRFSRLVGQLFDAMAEGGDFGAETIRRFDGNLFVAGPALDLTEQEIDAIAEAAKLDWSAVDPSIFGTLFERGLDPDKRSQLGAHYTSRHDIETLVEPVVMQPLRREWEEVKRLIENLLATGKKEPKGNEKPPAGNALKKAETESLMLIRRFLGQLAHVTVLDPACGSGNFLYVTLQKLKDLEKEAILHAQQRLGTSLLPFVGPWQLHGIEINPYAFELAQMTVWIGYLQWVRNNGFGVTDDPVLRPMTTFECKDAILDLSDPEHPREPDWPKVDYIVGNPPFLGTKKLRGQLGDAYTETLFSLYQGRIPNFSDLCCYWFEKARAAIEQSRCKRAGLLATQSIRGGLNRVVLERIKQTGDIFFAVSDRDWIIDGTSVHISMVAFDAAAERERLLDGALVENINSNLTTSTDTTKAVVLKEQTGRAFIADVKAGAFDVRFEEAVELLEAPNPNGRPTSDVLLPYANGVDVLRRNRQVWVIDFGVDLGKEDAAGYEAAFSVVVERVLPLRRVVNRKRYRELWWLHAEPCGEMRASIVHLDKCLVTPTVSKHRVFAFLARPVLPDHQLVVVATAEPLPFGILHSRVHETWARAQGTQVRERESGFRYTPTSCFETFPFPRLGPEHESLVAEVAGELDGLRSRWLNPPEWTREDLLAFPGSIDGPWKRYVHDPDARGIGTVRWPRVVARDEECAEKLKKRTLTNLYNERPAWLDQAHRKLDEAVFAAYGWPPDLGDEQLLERLLALNLERAAEEGAAG